ncbi:MAG: cell division protein FtsZ [Bacillota bacterium]
MQNEAGVVKIKVIGVGGGGSNAVNHMISVGVKSAEFIAANTDMQALMTNKAQTRIQLGVNTCKGLGAGSDPAVGRAAAEESANEIKEAIQDANLLFITAGMGGGTGTGAAPVVAEIAQQLGILTIAFVTKPFESFEGKIRMTQACKGIEELYKFADSVLVIPNEKISDYVPEGLPFIRAFEIADDVLRYAIQGIADIITIPSLINLDFSDIKKIMKNAGNSHIGIGRAKGDKRMVEAVKQAALSPLIETSLLGATGIILHVAGGNSLALDEVKGAAALVQNMVSPKCTIIFGAGIDPELGEDVSVTIIATGFKNGNGTMGSIFDRGAQINGNAIPSVNPVVEPPKSPITPQTIAVEPPKPTIAQPIPAINEEENIPSPRMRAVETDIPKFVSMLRDSDTEEN